MLPEELDELELLEELVDELLDELELLELLEELELEEELLLLEPTLSPPQAARVQDTRIKGNNFCIDLLLPLLLLSSVGDERSLS